MSRAATLVALALLLTPPRAQAQSPQRPALAVKTFENPTADAASTIGSGLTQLFITELEKTGRYRIIEREALDALTDEVDRTDSGYLDPETAVKKGHVLGFDYWFMAGVTNFGADEKTVAGVTVTPLIGGLGVHRKTARVRLDFRVVDATSGETVLADFGEAQVKKSSMGGAGLTGVLDGGQFYQNEAFLDSMLGKATIEAIGQVIAKLNARLPQVRASVADARRDAARAKPARVLAVVGSEAFVDVGADAGVAVGDALEAREVTDVRNAAGEVVYQDEKILGELTVTDVQPGRCRATIPAGVAIAEGNVVRLKFPPPTIAEPASVAPPETAPETGGAKRPRRAPPR